MVNGFALGSSWFDITNDLAGVFWQPSRMASSSIRLTMNDHKYCHMNFVAMLSWIAALRSQLFINAC